MSTKIYNTKPIETHKYTMDQRAFELAESTVNKEIVIIPHFGVDFFVSFEKEDKKSHVIAIDPNPIFDRIENMMNKTNNLGANFENQDYKLYGFLPFAGKPFFYDLFINENYFDWEDLQTTLRLFEIPIARFAWRGIVNSVEEIKELMLKKAGKKEAHFLFKPVVEDLSISYSGGARAPSTVAKEPTAITAAEEIDILLADDIISDRNFNNQMLLEFSSKDLPLAPIVDIDVDPYIFYTIVDEDGELNEEAIKAFFDFHAKKENIRSVINILEYDGVELKTQNRSEIIDLIDEYLASQITDDAFLTSPKYIKNTISEFNAIIKKEIHTRSSDLADKLIHDKEAKEFSDSYIDVDEGSVLYCFKTITEDIHNIDGLIDGIIYDNIWDLPKANVYCLRNISLMIVDELYGLKENSVIHAQCIEAVTKIIRTPVFLLAKDLLLKSNVEYDL